MTVEVRIISTETVKPSTPTPHHLKTHKLSFLDQLHPTIFSHVGLCYVMDNSNPRLNISQELNHLKYSLSKTLTQFYPLAGRIKDDQLSIDCNDDGLYYSESRVNCRLSNFLRKPDLDLLNNFFPCHPNDIERYARVHPAMVQINLFDCSGIVIGLCLSHKILDGISTSAFLKGWAASARGCFGSVCPSFNAASLFPPNDQLPVDSIAVLGRAMVRTGNCVTRRFLFDAAAIAALKREATAGSGTGKSLIGTVQHPSRVEVVTAFIWKLAISASRANRGGFPRPSILSHAVDLRRRMEPPLGEFSVGNLLWIPNTQCTVDDDIELATLVYKLRETITKINGDFVRKLQTGEGLLVTCENVKDMAELCSKGPVDYYGFTSWSRFRIYETDFGWGKPAWVSSHQISGSVFMNLVHMLETRGGDGVEAWVTLDERDMALLLAHPHFLSFASVDPSPLP